MKKRVMRGWMGLLLFPHCSYSFLPKERKEREKSEARCRKMSLLTLSSLLVLFPSEEGKSEEGVRKE